MVGIKSLARHLDISIGTVSRALNGKPDVNEETRRRVIEAAATLGYTPNQSGRSLRKGSTGIIAAMIPAGGATPLGDTIFMSVLDGMRAELEESGLDLVILLGGKDDTRLGFLKRVVERGLSDGIVLSDTFRRDERIEYLVKRRIPFVSFGRSATLGEYSWIDMDFEAMTEAAVGHLLALGRQRLALALPASEINYGFVIEQSFREALANLDFPLEDELVGRVPSNDDGGYAFATHLLEAGEMPDAVILTDVAMALGFYRRLVEVGLRPGRDIAVLALLERANMRFLSPALTCFKLDLTGLGRELGAAIVRQLPQRADADNERLIRKRWPAELVIGESDVEVGEAAITPMGHSKT